MNPAQDSNLTLPVPPLKRFRFLSQHMDHPGSRPGQPSNSAAAELQEYIQNCPNDIEDGMSWWSTHITKYPKISALALDVLAAPASEAYVEPIFSVCGDLTTGKRNRGLNSLEKKVFLKLIKTGSSSPRE